MIELRFLCQGEDLYWHAPKDDKPGILNSERIHAGKTGILVFREGQDYPAFYLYDEAPTEKSASFYLVAIDINGNAFIILQRHVRSSEAIRSLILDYRPKHTSEILYSITNQNNDIE